MDRVVIAPRGTSIDAPLSPGIRFGNILFVAGLVAGEAEGLEAQTRAVLDKIGAVLRAAGTDYRHVLRCGVYLTDIRNWQAMNAIYREYFPKDPPARTTIECKLADPRLLVEIDCVAAIPGA
jgi:2-iminobutanoate/2-iminopropanoate deaminase